MPSKNLQKNYLEDAYYHVYNRGINKRNIFLDKKDYAVFLNLLKRYLDKKFAKDSKGREYDRLHGRLELLAFCLLPNHFHLLLYQYDTGAMTRLASGVFTSYTTYFNKKYKRVGPLFQARYKASHITQDSYLQHISRYIHLNPQKYKEWEFSSLPYYLDKKQAEWVKPDKILGLFEDREDYSRFVQDYEAQRNILDELKSELADQ